MKKYIILLSVFVVIFAGLLITVKVLEGNSPSASNPSVLAGSDSAQSTSSFDSMNGSGVVTELGGESNATDNPEGDSVNQYTIIMNAKLEESDWSLRQAAGLTNEAIAATMEASKGLYGYDNIGIGSQQLYAEILLVMQGHHTRIPLCSTDATQIETVSECVLLDHPEIFYVDGYSYEKYMFAGIVEKIMYTANYTMTVEEASQNEILIQEYVDACMQGMPQGATDYDKVKYVYEFVILNTEYNLNAPENQNICSVFLYRESVCLGYAKAIQYLLQQMDVECCVVTGSVITGEGHAWNLVKINEQYYYVDATWGDASYLSDVGTASALSNINYDYLCITTTDLLKTHVIDNPVKVPNCIMTIDNYYVKEGLYLNSLDSLKIKSIFDVAYDNNMDCISIRCANETVFREVQSDLLDNQKIFSYLRPQTETLAYIYNEDLYTYTFML